MLNAVHMLGGSYYFPRVKHAPRSLFKSLYGEYYQTHPEALERNLSCRFRDEKQFRPDVVCYLLMQKRGMLKYRQPKGELVEYYPHGGMKRLIRKMKLITKKDGCKFITFNSLDKATPGMFAYIKAIMEEILDSGPGSNKTEIQRQ